MSQSSPRTNNNEWFLLVEAVRETGTYKHFVWGDMDAALNGGHASDKTKRLSLQQAFKSNLVIRMIEK
jgi:hypothetical protein